LEEGESSVGLITPKSTISLRPFSLWVDIFREMLFEAGWRLKIYTGTKYYRTNPSATLNKLVEQNGHTSWVLVLSSVAMQRWFQARQLPAVLAGTNHENVSLPGVDIDHRAICRHAVGTLIRAGHRHMVLFLPQSRRAGDLRSEVGFFEGISTSAYAKSITANVIYHDDVDAQSINKCLTRLFMTAPERRPTAMIIANPYVYVTTRMFLAENGLKVPQDVSLIAREDDPLFSYLTPNPSRYLNQSEIYARKLMHMAMELPTHRHAVASECQYLLPKFFAGKTVARPPDTEA
ncbi:MAG: substrate-binding domain-containing protein, partial [Puniceicoccales bacterium]